EILQNSVLYDSLNVTIESLEPAQGINEVTSVTPMPSQLNYQVGLFDFDLGFFSDKTGVVEIIFSETKKPQIDTFNMTIYIVVFSLLFFAIVLCAAFISFLCYFGRLRKVIARQDKDRRQMQALLLEMDSTYDESMKFRHMHEWNIDIKDITLNDRIAEGSYGVVYKGLFQGSDIAAKMLKADCVDDNEFSHEVQMLSSVRHPNILLFIGVSVKDQQKLIITEYMAGRSLYDVLFGTDLNVKRIAKAKFKRSRTLFLVPMTDSAVHQALHFGNKVAILADVAKGMAYLHSLSIVHRDLKLHNILLDKHGSAKIGDMGNSKFLLSTNQVISTEVGTIQYMSPEIILKTDTYGEKSDVYSFSIVMWELFFEKKAYKDEIDQDKTNLWNLGFDVAKKRIRPLITQENYYLYPREEQLYLDLVQQCWSHEPDLRPDFAFICTQLTKMLNNQF
ncbi:hypothetical protein AKO1_005449, partial [Acrasis kona]